NLDSRVRSEVDAFVRGVNAGIREGRRQRCHELALLRSKPTLIHSVDAVGVVKLLSFAMATNWDCELARLHILLQDGPAALEALHLTYPHWHNTSVEVIEQAGESFSSLASDLSALGDFLGIGGGSNNWIVSGSRTASGRPILANDPHLPPSLPNPWYLCHMRTPERTVVGANFAGSPGFCFGYNGKVAWGVTAGHCDNTDLFVESLSPDGESARGMSGWEKCQTRVEKIEVRGGKTVTELVRETARGPIVTPVIGEEAGLALSMSAVWLGTGPASGVLDLHRAERPEDIREIMNDWPGLSMNVLSGDQEDIAFQLVGMVPKRTEGRGVLPQPAWLDKGWAEGMVPMDEMPSAKNPDCGYFATANNRPLPEGKGPFLGEDWFDGYRQAEIARRLGERTDWDVESCAALQLDESVVPWVELRECVLSAEPGDTEAREVLALLAAWDGKASQDSPAAAVFEFFLADMIRRVVQAKAPKSLDWALGRGFMELAPNSNLALRRVAHVVELIQSAPEGWFQSSWQEQISEALSNAAASLRARSGNQKRWRWGDVRPLTMMHPLGEAPGLGAVFNIGPMPIGGNTNSINVAAVDPANPTNNPIGIATMRMVVEVGNWEN
ncbi:MAG: penicillin acylase family protein, partial [Myxococcales bacterium]|nr:penicillin acylase family protein [Myxococcales bacterium]